MKTKNKLTTKNSILLVGVLILLIIGAILLAKPLTKEEIIPSSVGNDGIALPMDTGVFGEITPHSSDKGVAVIGETIEPQPQPQSLTHSPDTIWENEQYTGPFTPVEKAVLKNGSLGVLTINAIGLSTNIAFIVCLVVPFAFIYLYFVEKKSVYVLNSISFTIISLLMILPYHLKGNKYIEIIQLYFVIATLYVPIAIGIIVTIIYKKRKEGIFLGILLFVVFVIAQLGPHWFPNVHGNYYNLSTREIEEIVSGTLPWSETVTKLSEDPSTYHLRNHIVVYKGPLSWEQTEMTASNIKEYHIEMSMEAPLEMKIIVEYLPFENEKNEYEFLLSNEFIKKEKNKYEYFMKRVDDSYYLESYILYDKGFAHIKTSLSKINNHMPTEEIESIYTKILNDLLR